MNKTRLFLLAITSVLTLVTTSCGKSGKALDTPTSGKIHITVDESYQPMMEAQEQVFEDLYPYADVSITYTNEVAAFKDLIADSSRFVVVNRDLNDSEKEYFKSIELNTQTLKIAYDGLAFIVNYDAGIKKLLYSQVEEIFTGKITTWNQLHPSLQKDSIRIVFDHPQSGNIRMIKETFQIKGDLPPNCFALNSNQELVEYVEKNKNAMGILSVNWISDKADSTANTFLKKIKVMSIGEKGNQDTTAQFRGPYQGYIAEETYPFRRTCYIVKREARAGLGTGFASFIAGEKGQRIILRSGMVPAVSPVRIIQMNN